MNIGGSLGMANIINDAGISAIAGSMNTSNGTVEFSGESTFQRMMAQMMESNGMARQSECTVQVESETAPEGNEKESNGIGQVLAGLLFGNAGQIKLKLENASGEELAIKESSTDQDKHSDLKEIGTVTLASILARFDGPVNAALISDDGSTAVELTKSVLDIDARKTLAQSIGVDGNGIGLINRMTDLLNTETNPDTSDTVAKIISQTVGDDGSVSLLTEINGRNVEFTGFLKEHPSKLAEDDTEPEPVMTATEVSEMDQTGKVTQTAQQPMAVVSAESLMSPSQEEHTQMSTSEDEPGSGISSMKEGLQTAAHLGQLQTTAKAEVVEMNLPAQSVGNAEAYGQIREEILSKLEQKGPTEFKMQLKPEELGEIDINLKLSEGKLIIDILAANAKTQALLTSQVDKLISSMGLQNVQVESINVSQQMNLQTQDNNQSQGYLMNSSMDFSQRKQQEQYRQELQNHAALNGAFGRQQDETQTANPMNRMESIRYDSHRINYAV